MRTGSGTTGEREWPCQASAPQLRRGETKLKVDETSIRGNLALPQGQGLAEAEGTQPGVILRAAVHPQLVDRLPLTSVGRDDLPPERFRRPLPATLSPAFLGQRQRHL